VVRHGEFHTKEDLEAAASCKPVLNWVLDAKPLILVWYYASDLHIIEMDLPPENTTQVDPVLRLRGLRSHPDTRVFTY
jgi:hypothetical protein